LEYKRNYVLFADIIIQACLPWLQYNADTNDKNCSCYNWTKINKYKPPSSELYTYCKIPVVILNFLWRKRWKEITSKMCWHSSLHLRRSLATTNGLLVTR